MAKLKASQGKTWTMFSNEECQQYIERLKAISQPGYVYSNCFYLKNSYHKSCSSVSSITYIALKIVFFSKTTNAKVTLHFPSFMNWCIESVQVQLTYKTSITNVAFERFLSFMNCCYMFIQIAFSSEINILPTI